MNIVCYAHAKHQLEAVSYFTRGLMRHGQKAIVKHPIEITDADLAVFWGHRQNAIINRQKLRKRHYLVMERGYIGDRFVWTSLGFDGLNGRAKFPKIEDGGERWNKHFARYFRDWKKRDNHTAVIMGQVRGDAALKQVNFGDWMREMITTLHNRGWEVAFRHHPGDMNFAVLDGAAILTGTLTQAIERAGLVVTYSSNSGVDALMVGCPIFAADPGSMVYDISPRQPVQTYPDRTPWTQKMAFTQWLPDEMINGEAWAALRTVIDG